MCIRDRFKGAPLPPVDGAVKLQVLADRTIMEIIGNGGRVYISASGTGRKPDLEKISVTAIGGDAKILQFEAHEMKSIWNAGSVR